MAPEREGQYFVRSSNLYGDPQTVLNVYRYDVQRDKAAVRKYCTGREPARPTT